VVDAAAAGLDIVFGGVTTTNKITLTDNLADALNITEGSDSYIKFITTNSSESIVFGKNSTFASTTIADLGTVTTADINGGTIDGATIGASSHTTGKFTTVDATTDFTIGGTVITDNTITDDGTLIIAASTATSFSDGNITNVGSLACDSMVVDDAAVGLDVVFGGNTTLNKITLTDNLADALNITEGSNSYMKFITTNSTELITFGVDDTGVDVRLFSATASEGVLYDASEDELALLLTTKLKFHDVGGGEEIFASADGHLEINAGTTLDITAPTVDVNASTAITLDTPSLIVSSATANKPLVEIKSTNDDQLGGELRFIATQGGTDGVDADVSGTISFYSNDDGTPTNQEFARIKGIAADTATGSESGKITMGVATTGSGAVADVITIVGGANAAGSTVTIAGNLTVDGTTTTINSTTLTVDDLNVVLASGAADSAAADGAGITIDGAGATLIYDHTGTQWEFNKPLEVTGTGTFSGILKTDDATEATSTTDGSLQTDGGLSVAKSAVIGDDLDLLSDSAIFSMGLGSDFTITHDGTTGATLAGNPITITSGGAATWSTSAGALTIDAAAAALTLDGHTGVTVQSSNSGDITLDSVADIVLDADGDDITFKAGSGDTTGLAFTNSSGTWTIKPGTSDSDLVFGGNDGGSGITALTLDMSAAGAATFNSTVTASAFMIGVENTTSSGAISKGFTDVSAGSNLTMTLPAGAAGSIGVRYTIKKIDSSTNTVTVHANGNSDKDKIDGGDSIILYHQYESVTVVLASAIGDDGFNYYIM